MKCGHCDYEWVAVSPVGTRELECPSCGEMTAVLISREEAIRASFSRGGVLEAGLLTSLFRKWAADMGLFEIVYSPHAYLIEDEEIERGWGERLFSWPWRPWVTTKVVEVRTPCMVTFPAADTGKLVIAAHPAMKQALEEAIRNSTWEIEEGL